MKRDIMNYYNEIKNNLIDVEIYKKVKDYSKNRYELERYYQVGKYWLMLKVANHEQSMVMINKEIFNETNERN